MAARALPASAEESRAQRIEAIMKERRPKVEATVRQMVERAVDVPEAEEFGTPTTRRPVRSGSAANTAHSPRHGRQRRDLGAASGSGEGHMQHKSSTLRGQERTAC